MSLLAGAGHSNDARKQSNEVSASPIDGTFCRRGGDASRICRRAAAVHIWRSCGFAQRVQSGAQEFAAARLDMTRFGFPCPSVGPLLHVSLIASRTLARGNALGPRTGASHGSESHAAAYPAIRRAGVPAAERPMKAHGKRSHGCKHWQCPVGQVNLLRLKSRQHFLPDADFGRDI
jgi:hypothetical protein